MNGTLIVGLVQLNSINDTAYNLNSVINIIQQAEKNTGAARAQLLIFPENCLFFRLGEGEKIQSITLQSPEMQALEKESARVGIHLHLTTPVLEGGHVWNASVLIRPGKKAEIVYKKIHLFDIALKDQKPIRESEYFKGGEHVTAFEIEDFKLGSSICYDIRFSELYHEHAKNKVDAILVPSAFLVKTGLAHWETLMRARAIESQCYILAPAQAGVHQSLSSEHRRETFGHTMVVGPWGDVQASLATGVGIVYGRLEKAALEAVRAQIPMAAHRRL